LVATATQALLDKTWDVTALADVRDLIALTVKG